MQHVYQIAYRHVDGNIEGFVGKGHSEDEAESDAMRQIQQMCARLKVAFEARRVIRDQSDVSPTEQKLLLAQWRKLGGTS
jgi:hypothetical protein